MQIPTFASRTVVTLDIDNAGIRLLEVDGERVIRWGSQSLEPGIVEGGTVVIPQALGAAIRDLGISTGIVTRRKNVVASVSGLYAATRIFSLQRDTPPTRQAVLQRAQELMPVPVDKLYLSWGAVAAEDHAYRIFVAGIHRDVIDSLVRSLRAANVSPRALTLKGAALSRAVGSRQAVIINTEPSSFDVVLVLDGVPELMRTISWRPGSLSSDEVVGDLSAALEATVHFYESQHPGFYVDRATPLFMTGEMSRDMLLTEQLEARLGYAAEPLVPALEVPPDLPVSQYAVNIGLALAGRRPSPEAGRAEHAPSDINVLPEAYRGRRLTTTQTYCIWLMVAGVALLFPFFQRTSSLMSMTANLETRQATQVNEMQRRQIEIKNRAPLEQTLKQYNAIVGMRGSFLQDIDLIYGLGDELQVVVNSVVHDGKSITVDCEAETDVAFKDFVSALQKSGRFYSVTPPLPRYPYPAGGTIKLTLSAPAGPPKKAPAPPPAQAGTK